MHISHYGFVFLVGFSNKKCITVKKEKYCRKNLEKNIFHVFVNNSGILPI